LDVGTSHDVDENKGTYFYYPTMLMKIDMLFDASNCDNQGLNSTGAAASHFLIFDVYVLLK